MFIQEEKEIFKRIGVRYGKSSQNPKSGSLSSKQESISHFSDNFTMTLSGFAIPFASNKPNTMARMAAKTEIVAITIS
ncbi:hypothetical protein M7775_19525 [Sporomusa sphaeroides DSM 2875]|uniref:hypothetical protein n=1 Tax=Sporomusa sphaeroides TaxID=47679 RepID=UPI0020307198|nr:hypothetical protein [Sporomusa sphaeroides]MCM0760742.1 hypothetical protein [Sporomusa sphaeroides DSM 2875]